MNIIPKKNEPCVSGKDQNTFVVPVIFVYKLYIRGGGHSVYDIYFIYIFHFPTRHLLVFPFPPPDGIFIMKAIIALFDSSRERKKHSCEVEMY